MTNIVDSSGNAFSVDRSPGVSYKPRIIKFSFGDGYEQRAIDGINNIDQTFDISFNNRLEADMENLITFFETNAGVTAFGFAPTHYPTATATNVASNVITGTGLTGFDSDSWVLLTGTSAYDSSYSIDSGGTNNSTTLTVYSPTIGSPGETGTFTVHKAVGVVCESWSISQPNTGVLSLRATLQRVYQP